MEKATIFFSETADKHDKKIYILTANLNEAGVNEFSYYDEKEHLKRKQEIIEKALSKGFAPESDSSRQDFLDGRKKYLDVIKGEK
jgi:hypothetical protein